jgi:hypothetical protein
MKLSKLVDFACLCACFAVVAACSGQQQLGNVNAAAIHHAYAAQGEITIYNGVEWPSYTIGLFSETTDSNCPWVLDGSFPSLLGGGDYSSTNTLYYDATCVPTAPTNTWSIAYALPNGSGFIAGTKCVWSAKYTGSLGFTYSVSSEGIYTNCSVGLYSGGGELFTYRHYGTAVQRPKR